MAARGSFEVRPSIHFTTSPPPTLFWQAKLEALRSPISEETNKRIMELGMAIQQDHRLMDKALPVLLTLFLSPNKIPEADAALEPETPARFQAVCACNTLQLLTLMPPDALAQSVPVALQDPRGRALVKASSVWKWVEFLMIQGVTRPTTDFGRMAIRMALNSFLLLNCEEMYGCLPDVVQVVVGAYVTQAQSTAVRRIIGELDVALGGFPANYLFRLFVHSNTRGSPEISRRNETISTLLHSSRDQIIPAVSRHLELILSSQPVDYERLLRHTHVLGSLIQLPTFLTHPQLLNNTRVELLMRVYLAAASRPLPANTGRSLGPSEAKYAAHLVHVCTSYFTFMAWRDDCHRYLPQSIESGLLTALRQTPPWLTSRWQRMDLMTMPGDDPLTEKVRYFYEGVIVPHMWIFRVYRALLGATEDKTIAADLSSHAGGRMVLSLLDRWKDVYAGVQPYETTPADKCFLAQVNISALASNIEQG
jgi:hypothetical protein